MARQRGYLLRADPGPQSRVHPQHGRLPRRDPVRLERDDSLRVARAGVPESLPIDNTTELGVRAVGVRVRQELPQSPDVQRHRRIREAGRSGSRVQSELHACSDGERDAVHQSQRPAVRCRGRGTVGGDRDPHNGGIEREIELQRRDGRPQARTGPEFPVPA